MIHRKFTFWAGIALVVFGLSLIAGYLLRTPSREISRVELEQLLASKTLVQCRITPTPYNGIYQVQARSSVGKSREKLLITTHLDDAQLTALFSLPAKVTVPGEMSRVQWISLISTLCVGAVIVFVIVRQTGGGHGKSAAVTERPMVSFREVAGIEEAKAEVQEIVDFLRDPEKYRRLGGKLPKGVLLIGPPGTGKTMLAKAIATEGNARFFSTHGSDFTEVFVGMGARRIRQLFRQAARSKPAIIFIDEIDCVGKSRKQEMHSEHQQTINALLAAMDGFESSQGVIVLAATNRAEDLDEALLRPGRFDRKVYVPYPDMKGRRAILEAHAATKPIENPAPALDMLAQTTPGMSGADLANLLNEAAIQCALKNAKAITITDLEASRDKIRYGKERKSMVLKHKEREMVAFHEAGHTLIHLQTALMPPLYKVSIVPRGQALGVTTLLPDEDQNLQTREFLLEQLLVLMGGRAAEKTFFGCTTNGAGGDLDMARKIARKMIHEWGMGQRLYYEQSQSDAEKEINRLLADADARAHEMVLALKAETEKLARALLDRETLTKDEVLALVGRPGVRSLAA